MRRAIMLLALVVAVTAAAVAGMLAASGPSTATASSHREAPLIGDDPSADNTDLYAFVSPDAKDTVTLIANYIPFEDPAGGPNYYKFDPTALYELKVDNNGDAREDVTYQFRFKTTVANPNTFLYNTGPIGSDGTSPNLNVKQTYTVTRVVETPGGHEEEDNETPRGHEEEDEEHGDDGKGSGHGQSAGATTDGHSGGSSHEMTALESDESGGTREVTVLASDVPVPPANIGPRSNPTYDPTEGVMDLGHGRKVFAGPRDDPFFVDLGSIFDLLGLRPFNTFHLLPLAAEAGVDGVQNYNVHTIALQVPKTDLVRTPDHDGTIGVYATASRPKLRVLRGDGSFDVDGPMVQVSRLGNPLVNEVVIPLGKKDFWNASDPKDDSQFLQHYRSPELTGLINLLYPPLPDAPVNDRDDLVAVLLTGVPGLNFTGETKADLLRLNTAIPPAASPNKLGALAGDFQGFPNGRRLADDVTDIEIRAAACGYGDILGAAPPAGLGLCNLSPNNAVGDGVDENEQEFLSEFPYVAAPNQGYAHTGHK